MRGWRVILALRGRGHGHGCEAGGEAGVARGAGLGGCLAYMLAKCNVCFLAVVRSVI